MNLAIQVRTLYGVIAVLVAIVIIVSSVGGLYYVKYASVSSNNSIYLKQLDQLGVKYTPNILIDYGNGTSTWYNDTALAPGSNLYTATVLVTNGNVNASFSEQYQEHFVTGIGGVGNTNTEFWWLWTYNSTASWQTAMVGPDDLPITNGVVYAWAFCGMTSSGNPTCTP
jgi:hypothetical protein